MAHTVWKLRDYLKAHNLSAYQLAKALPESRQPTIYRLASDSPPTSVNLDVLGRIVAGLRDLTGEPVSPNDVLEVIDTPTLRSLKPGEVGDDKLRSTPAKGKFNPRGPRIKTKDGSLISDAVDQNREERAASLARVKR
jgi:hypothetical protein